MPSLQETLQSMDPQKRAAFLAFLKSKLGGGQPGAQPGAQPNGPMPGPMTAGGPAQPPGMFAGMKPGAPGLPGIASPEEAARSQADTARRASVPGMLDSVAGKAPAGNIFAGNKNWFSGMVDQTNRTGPFDSFYVDNARSDSWL